MIKFWQKESGNALSHKQGISDIQLEYLQELKEGDRLILWRDREDDGTVTYKLKIFKPKNTA